MNKKNLTNLLIIVLGYIIPLQVFRSLADNYANIQTIQYIVFAVFLAGSLTLVYLNNKNRKQAEKGKGWWIFFEIIGVLGTCFSVFILVILIIFRNFGW